MKVKRLNLEKYKFVQRFIQAVNGFNQARQDDSLEGWVTLNHQHIHFNDEGIPDIGNPMVFGKKSFSEVDRSHVVPGQITKRPKPAAQNPGSSSSTAPAVSHETARKIVEGLPTSDQIQTGAQRKNFAKKIAEKLGININRVKFGVRALKNNGQCAFYVVGGKMLMKSLTLDSDDERPVEYQIKTAFHEAFHLSADGKDADMSGSFMKGWHECEEMITECAANYMYSQYSGGGKLVPSYPGILASYLPSLKNTDMFSGCNTIDDVGRVALENRMKGQGSSWSSLFGQLEKRPLTDSYYTQYFGYIKENKKSILDALEDAWPSARGLRTQMENDFDLVFNNDGHLSIVDENQQNIYEGVLAYTMLKEGIK